MHEALITKGMVRGNKHALMINNRNNCVLRHNQCPDGQKHEPGIGSEEVYLACLNQLIKFEGLDSIMEWLKEMTEYFPGVAEEASRRAWSYNE